MSPSFPGELSITDRRASTGLSTLGGTMKLGLLSVLVVLFGASSFARAESLYPCTIEFEGQQRNIYLSKARSIDVVFGARGLTRLQLRVTADETLTGTVNGQPNFIIQGDVDSGFVQSAYGQGKIQCGSPTDFSVIYVFQPWNQIYTPAGDFNVIQRSLQAGNTCYAGSPEQALADYQSEFGLSARRIQLDAETRAIQIHTTDQICTEDNGGTYDDFNCVAHETRAVVKTIPNCDYDAEPR